MPRSPAERATRPPGPPPDRASLYGAALHHLSRYAATEAGLVRVLDRRIARWLRAAEQPTEAALAPRAAAREVARALVASGAIDDAAFAAARTRRLLRTGRSRRAMSAHLAAKGVDADIAGAALPEPEEEFLAAVAHARRRRVGPFATGADDPERARRALAAMARAGFPRDAAERALALDRDEAERLLLQLKQS